MKCFLVAALKVIVVLIHSVPMCPSRCRVYTIRQAVSEVILMITIH